MSKLNATLTVVFCLFGITNFVTHEVRSKCAHLRGFQVLVAAVLLSSCSINTLERDPT